MVNAVLQIELPIIVHANNMGAMFMTKNISTAGRTKHLDLRMRYMHHLVEEGFLTPVFVETT